MLRCARNDVDIVSPSRGAGRPRFAFSFALSKSEGAGKTGCLLHPRSRVRFAQTKGHTSIQGSGTLRPSLRNGFTAYFVLFPGAEFLLASLASGLMADRSGWTRCRITGSLAPATGARTTRFCRTHQRRSSCARVPGSRIRPALRAHHAPDADASTASHRAFVTIAIRPS